MIDVSVIVWMEAVATCLDAFYHNLITYKLLPTHYSAEERLEALTYEKLREQRSWYREENGRFQLQRYYNRNTWFKK